MTAVLCRPDCRTAHRSDAVAARHRLDAIWAVGEGSWALVAWCQSPWVPGGPSVTLWPTREEALAAQVELDRTGCGGSCSTDHTVEDLSR